MTRNYIQAMSAETPAATTTIHRGRRNQEQQIFNQDVNNIRRTDPHSNDIINNDDNIINDDNRHIFSEDDDVDDDDNDNEHEDDFDEDDDDDEHYEQAMDIFVKHFDHHQQSHNQFKYITSNNKNLDHHETLFGGQNQSPESMLAETIELTTFSGAVLYRKQLLKKRQKHFERLVRSTNDVDDDNDEEEEDADSYNYKECPPNNNGANDINDITRNNQTPITRQLLHQQTSSKNTIPSSQNKTSKNNRPLSISSISSAASSGSSASSNSSASSGIQSSLTRNSSINYSQNEFRMRNLSYAQSAEDLNLNNENSQHERQVTELCNQSSSLSSETSANICNALNNLKLSSNPSELGGQNQSPDAETRAAILAAGELQRKNVYYHPTCSSRSTTSSHSANDAAASNDNNDVKENSKLSRINRTFHASLRYDKNTAHRIHMMANARGFSLRGQTKTYNFTSTATSAIESTGDATLVPTSLSTTSGLFRRYSMISRNNSSTSSDSSHSGVYQSMVCRCGAYRKLSENETISSASSSFTTSSDQNKQLNGVKSKAATLDGSYRLPVSSSNHYNNHIMNHHPTCPSFIMSPYANSHQHRPLRASPRLHQSPSSVSSYSNTSSLFRDDGFEEDLTNSTTNSEHSSAIHPISQQQKDHYNNNRLSVAHHQQQSSLLSSIASLPHKQISSPIASTIATTTSTLHGKHQILISNPRSNTYQQQRLRVHQEQELPLLSISQRVVTEIIETERSYVDDLEQIVSGYLCKLRDVLDQHQDLFSNLEDIYKFNKDFLFQLEECYLNAGSIASCFVENAPKFDVYTHYCTMYPQVVSTLTEMMAQPSTAQMLKECQLELKQNLPLGAYLLKPVQRILKYHILFKSLSKHTSEDLTVSEEDRASISEAVSIMTNIACHINEMKKRHEHSIRVQELQSLLCGWEVSVVIE